MKDDNGLYYYPSLQSRETRMYVRQSVDGVEFRLWSSSNPEIWERHGWVPYEAVVQASAMYKEERDSNRNPLGLYDLDVAKKLIKEEG